MAILLYLKSMEDVREHILNKKVRFIIFPQEGVIVLPWLGRVQKGDINRLKYDILMCVGVIILRHF
jgi:hypothetical protein